MTLFSDMVFKKLPFSLRLKKKLTLFYDAVNKAWNMPAPQNQRCVFVRFWGGNNKTSSSTYCSTDIEFSNSVIFVLSMVV